MEVVYEERGHFWSRKCTPRSFPPELASQLGLKMEGGGASTNRWSIRSSFPPSRYYTNLRRDEVPFIFAAFEAQWSRDRTVKFRRNLTSLPKSRARERQRSEVVKDAMQSAPPFFQASPSLLISCKHKRLLRCDLIETLSLFTHATALKKEGRKLGPPGQVRRRKGRGALLICNSGVTNRELTPQSLLLLSSPAEEEARVSRTQQVGREEEKRKRLLLEPFVIPSCL